MSLGFGRIIRYGMQRGLPSEAGFSRRHFLKLSAAAAVTAALGGCARRTVKYEPAPDAPRVAVVGAGFAGLACADTLARNGADVRVFEASTRPGGRVLTNRRFVPDRNVEYGGEFVGTNHPTWIAYARRFGIELAPVVEYDGDPVLLLDGRLLPTSEADALYKEIDRLTAMLIKLARPIDPERPWRSPDARDLDRTSFADFLSQTELSPRARRIAAALAEADNGVPPEKMSLLALLALVAGGGFEDYFLLSETHRAAGGNDALATAIADTLGRRVRYKAPVASIRRSAGRAFITAGIESPWECDAVVLAIPPSVWHRIAFENPLGAHVPQMGVNTKLIAKLSRPVWEDAQLSPNLVADGIVQLTWVSAENDPGLPKGFTMFSGGEQCERLRNIPAGQRTREATQAIRAAYPDVGAAIIESRFIDWPGMSNALGSYSFPAPGEVTRYGRVLVDGWDDGMAPLRFAGEHTSYGFIGYMEGALQSGVRAAEQVLAMRGVAVSSR